MHRSHLWDLFHDSHPKCNVQCLSLYLQLSMHCGRLSMSLIFLCSCMHHCIVITQHISFEMNVFLNRVLVLNRHRGVVSLRNHNKPDKRDNCKGIWYWCQKTSEVAWPRCPSFYGATGWQVRSNVRLQVLENRTVGMYFRKWDVFFLMMWMLFKAFDHFNPSRMQCWQFLL